MSSSNRADAEAKTLRDDTVVDETPGDVRPFAWRELDTVHNRDVAQRLTIVLGTAETTSKQLRGLHAGSLVKLGQSVASPVTVFAGPRLVAHAEIVEEHGNLAFRVTRILGTA